MNLILPAEPDSAAADADASTELMEQHTLPRRAESDAEEGYAKEDKRDPMAV
jgi:hypothetical protein